VGQPCRACAVGSGTDLSLDTPGAMPKNKGKGGKNRRRGKNQNEPDKRELVFKEDGQEYAQVQRMLGNGRCECFCFDGTTRLGHIRGKMRKKVWINQVCVCVCVYRRKRVVRVASPGSAVNVCECQYLCRCIMCGDPCLCMCCLVHRNYLGICGCSCVFP